jgi:hypothetical protein
MQVRLLGRALLHQPSSIREKAPAAAAAPDERRQQLQPPRVSIVLLVPRDALLHLVEQRLRHDRGRLDPNPLVLRSLTIFDDECLMSCGEFAYSRMRFIVLKFLIPQYISLRSPCRTIKPRSAVAVINVLLHQHIASGPDLLLEFDDLALDSSLFLLQV